MYLYTSIFAGSLVNLTFKKHLSDKNLLTPLYLGARFILITVFIADVMLLIDAMYSRNMPLIK
jgi:hypothetical protein